MNRYAPELALVAGGVLGGSFGGFVLFVLGEFYSAAVVCALFGYPFAAYAIHTDDNPTAVLPPQGVTIVVAVITVGVVLDVLRLFGLTVDSLLFSSGPALVVLLPVVIYSTHYGGLPNWLSPNIVGLSTTMLAVGLLAGSLTTGRHLSAVSAFVVFVAGMTLWVRSNDGGVNVRLWPIGGLTLAGGLLGVSTTVGGSADRWVLAAMAVAFGPLLVVLLAVN